MVDDLSTMMNIDEKELQERLEATEAYFGETPEHFVEYGNAFYEESSKSSEDIREVMDECWNAYQTEIDYSDKEDWQAKAKTNDPFTAVKFASSIIKNALMKKDFFKLNGLDEGDHQWSKFFEEALRFWGNEQHTNYPIKITDAAEMGFAVGQSMELIPTWEEKLGLKLDGIPPWKIFRDPDAEPRNPWSGIGWLHEDWVDLWILKQGQKEGIYKNIGEIKEESSKEEKKDQERRNIQWERSKFRKAARLREFWGVILGKDNNILLPNGTYTFSGKEVIRGPTISPLVKTRWPGSSFSPIPNLLRYEGRGILEGVLTLWRIMNNLLCLYTDNFNWVVNKIREIFPSLLDDPGDLEIYPGSLKIRNSLDYAHPAIIESQSSANTSDFLAFAQYLQTKYDNGDFVSQLIQGLPGTRSQITKGEVQIKTSQNYIPFDSIGKDVEYGIINSLWSVLELIILKWNSKFQPSPMRVLGEKFPQESILFEQMPLDQRKEFLKMNCDITISSISSEIKQMEKLDKLVNFGKVLIQGKEKFDPYIKGHELLFDLADAFGFHNPAWIKTKEEIQKEIEAAKLIRPNIGGT